MPPTPAATPSAPARSYGVHRSPVSRARAAVLALAGVAASLAVAPAAHAACSAPVAEGSSVVVTCPFTGAEQSLTVPSDISQLRIVAIGGNGGGDVPGIGARADATLAIGSGAPVLPGATLFVVVGGNGNADHVGGFNGGGHGGLAPAGNGGGGGGASDVRTCSVAGCALTGVPATDPRLLVAAGGGGGKPGADGGAAGTPTPGGSGGGPAGGGGATSVAAGGSGAGPGIGADGVDSGSSIGGGGGGAGFFGGGGGGEGSGGGGGASYVAPAGTSPAFAAGDGNPRVTFTFTPNAAPPTPLAPTPIPSTPAPLAGSVPVAGQPVAPIRSEAVQGNAKIKRPGRRKFVGLAPNSPIPVGALVDTTTEGSRATIVADLTRAGRRSLARASLSLGQVKIVGPTRRDPRSLAMRLPTRTRDECSRRTQASAAQARRKRTAARKAKLKTRGAVTVVTGDAIVSTLGTAFTTTQSCAGTLVDVTQGSVSVRDLGKRVTVRVRAGRSYRALRRGR